MTPSPFPLDHHPDPRAAARFALKTLKSGADARLSGEVLAHLTETALRAMQRAEYPDGDVRALRFAHGAAELSTTAEQLLRGGA